MNIHARPPEGNRNHASDCKSPAEHKPRLPYDDLRTPTDAAELPLGDTAAKLPAIIQEALERDSEPDFWDDLAGVFEVIEQPRTAVYWTQSGHVGIRQQTSDPAFDRDLVVLIAPEYAQGIANAILAVARDIIEARKG